MSDAADDLHRASHAEATRTGKLSSAHGHDAPVSFKRRSRNGSGGFPVPRRWLRDLSRNSSTFSARHRMSGAQDGWEHPARYTNASQISVPSILPAMQATPQSNPIPMLPYTVLCLLIFGEFCSSGVAGPFLFFMLDSFHLGDESRVGFWAGIVSSIFFLAQFLTSLMWSSVADKHGRRFALRVSMIGNSLSLIAFGMAPNLPLAILFRLAQGFFNGAVGVAKGAIRSLTDETNEGRAYAQMGFWWGMGGIVGPILGGVLEHPADKFPWLFGHSAFLHAHPYVLPCVLAATSTIVGTVLSLFLEDDAEHDVGPIHLDSDPNSESHVPTLDDRTPMQSGWSYASSRWSRMRHSHDLHHWPMAFGRRTRPVSTGSAYGYGHAPDLRSSYVDVEDMPDDDTYNKRQSLVERFVLANDDTVLSITDLWVAAAANTEEVPEEPENDVIEEVDESDADSDHNEQRQQHEGPSASTYVPPMHFARASKLHKPDDTEEATVSGSEPGSPTNTSGPSVSPIWMLPLVVVGHYGMLSLHSSMFDQVFMAFLVTPEPSGGLGLTATHYAGLIAAMSLCQLLFQFHVYPNLGPPNGRLSHLAVLQLGVLIYLPCYVLFPFLRTFLLPSTDAFVMLAMIAFAAIRWLANILSFTAVMVLLNTWTPPHLVPLANGLAQTVSSFARCIGPITGGVVWAQSIHDGPFAHAWPFNYHLGFWLVGLVAFMGALHTRTMREVVLP